MSYKIENFENISEFYPYHLSNHKNNFNRLLHFVGIIISLFMLAYLLIQSNYFYIPVPLFIAFLFTWVGHFFFEKNKPATFKYPFKVCLCELFMVWKIANGSIISELKKYSIENKKYIDTDLF